MKTKSTVLNNAVQKMENSGKPEWNRETRQLLTHCLKLVLRETLEECAEGPCDIETAKYRLVKNTERLLEIIMRLGYIGKIEKFTIAVETLYNNLFDYIKKYYDENKCDMIEEEDVAEDFREEDTRAGFSFNEENIRSISLIVTLDFHDELKKIDGEN